MPFAVQRIDHAAFRVADVPRSEAFYRDVLGCETVKRRDDLGLLHLRLGDALLDLVDVAGPLGRKGGFAPGAQGHNLDHLCVRIEPFDEAAITAHLAAHGVQADGPAQSRFGADGQGLSLYFNDPDGNTIELKGGPA